ncbi:MAG TPA: divergent PAP2 family protein [Rectinemataceae bacterium]
MPMKSYDLRLLISNPLFLSAAASLAAAQAIKVAINLVRSGRQDAREAFLTFLWRTGGMPSSHSATAVSICASIAFAEGFSNLFILSLFFCLIVIRDALGVRRSSGLQAKALNRLGADLEDKYGLDYDPVREIHGHTWPEVAAGALLGFILAFLFSR